MIEILIEEIFLDQLMMILIAIVLLCIGFCVFMGETSDLVEDRKIGTLLLIVCMVVTTYAVLIIPMLVEEIK